MFFVKNAHTDSISEVTISGKYHLGHFFDHLGKINCKICVKLLN